MQMQHIVLAYFSIGILFGGCVELIMKSTLPNHNITNIERLTWIFVWPLYAFIFICSIKR
jgi:hypothetical protein